MVQEKQKQPFKVSMASLFQQACTVFTCGLLLLSRDEVGITWRFLQHYGHRCLMGVLPLLCHVSVFLHRHSICPKFQCLWYYTYTTYYMNPGSTAPSLQWLKIANNKTRRYRVLRGSDVCLHSLLSLLPWRDINST